jgi:hypothetical protein
MIPILNEDGIGSDHMSNGLPSAHKGLLDESNGDAVDFFNNSSSSGGGFAISATTAHPATASEFIIHAKSNQLNSFATSMSNNIFDDPFNASNGSADEHQLIDLEKNDLLLVDLRDQSVNLGDDGTLTETHFLASSNGFGDRIERNHSSSSNSHVQETPTLDFEKIILPNGNYFLFLNRIFPNCVKCYHLIGNENAFLKDQT